MSDNIPIKTSSSSSKRERPNQRPTTPTTSPQIDSKGDSNSHDRISPSASPPRKILAPSKLEQEIVTGDRNAVNMSLSHAIAFNNPAELEIPDKPKKRDRSVSPTPMSIAQDQHQTILERLQVAYW
jgi:hypothetical protein